MCHNYKNHLFKTFSDFVCKHKTFIKGMNNLGMLGEADALKDIVDLSGCKKMIDAGGGSGLYSIILCRAYPELQSTILDRSETLEVTKELIGPYKEKDRITLVEGDFTKDPFGEDIDAVLLSDVIYSDQEGRAALENSWKSLRPGGIRSRSGSLPLVADDQAPLFECLQPSHGQHTRPPFGARARDPE